RHDMRHHFLILDRYLEDGMIEEAKGYIAKYYNAIPYEESLTHCHHYGTNALLTYFTELAGQHQIPYEIRVDFPERLPVSDEDLTVVLGNLLENAMDACREAVNEEPDFKPYIKIAGNFDGQMILIAVENSALHEAKMDKKQRYLSTKHKGHGIGIDSIRTAAEKNNGFLKIEQVKGKFIANVMMM
ncbi:MAG: ATP-binding protein, partial [Lachnospiraceae bacterium]|nr:ATP-binding protein [Lachnospiraceae bacterium]